MDSIQKLQHYWSDATLDSSAKLLSNASSTCDTHKKSEQSKLSTRSSSQRGQVLFETLVLLLILGGIFWFMHKRVSAIEQMVRLPIPRRK